MKIINLTRYRTDQLRALAYAVARRGHDAAAGYAHYTVTFKHARRTGLTHPEHGRAWYRHGGHGRTTVWVNRDKACPAHTASVLAHELEHLRTGGGGRSWEIHHRRSKLFGWGDGWQELYAWTAEFAIDPAPVASKPTKEDRIVAETARTEKAIIRWKSKLKLAQTKLRKYNARLKYYERKTAALVAPPTVRSPPAGC